MCNDFGKNFARNPEIKAREKPANTLKKPMQTDKQFWKYDISTVNDPMETDQQSWDINNTKLGNTFETDQQSWEYKSSQLHVPTETDQQSWNIHKSNQAKSVKSINKMKLSKIKQSVLIIKRKYWTCQNIWDFIWFANK